jgi:hypothetical protein
MSQAMSQGKQTQRSTRISGAVVMGCIVGGYVLLYVLLSVFSTPRVTHPWLLGADTKSHSGGTERPAKTPSTA